MLLISSKQITDNFTNLILLSTSEVYLKDNTDFNLRFLKTAVQIRNLLQTTIIQPKEIYIDNIFSKNKVNEKFIFNTVYLKGGIVTDFFIYNDINSLVISDLDYHVEIKDESVIDPNIKQICIRLNTLISYKLKWFSKYMVDPNSQIILDKLFDGQDSLHIYNAYDQMTPVKIFNRNSTIIESKNLTLRFSYSEINDSITLIRFYYGYTLVDNTTNNNFFIKNNIIDYSINFVKDKLNIYSSSILQTTYFTKDDFIITQNKLSLFNDQLKTLINSIIIGSSKYIKRKLRVQMLLNTITIHDLVKTNIFICKYKNIPPFFIKLLKSNKIIELIAESKMFYPFILIPCIIWLIKNKKYIKPKIYTPQIGEFYYNNNLIGKTENEVNIVLKQNITDLIKHLKLITDVTTQFYNIVSKTNITKNIIENHLYSNKNIILTLFKFKPNRLLKLYLSLDTNTRNEYRKTLKYWDQFKQNKTFIDDDYIYMFLKLL